MNAAAGRVGTELVLSLDEVDPRLAETVVELGFGREDERYVRRFPADARHAEAAAERFPRVAEALVLQAAGLELVPWDEALEEVARRLEAIRWWLVGSAALAARGVAVRPRDLDLIVDAGDAVEAADRLADALVEPLAPGGWLGRWWMRAFLGARIEAVGGVEASLDEPEPTDFGVVAAGRLESVRWRGFELLVPPLDLQLRAAERRGLGERVRAIREAVR